MDSEPRDLLQAALSGRYQIERELGRGGMATVYLAEDLKHGRRVALKVLRPELTPALGAERFLREIAIAARLQHPHILSLHDSGEAGGMLYYAMPYVEGESLRARLAREVQLDAGDAVADRGGSGRSAGVRPRGRVLHRDIKPENILLAGGQAVVADFGIARALDAVGADRLTETGLALGTPHYMSPGQALRGTGAGCPKRHLCARLRAVRDAGGGAAVQRLDGAGDPGSARGGSGSLPPHGSIDHQSRARSGRREVVGEGAGGPVRHGPRVQGGADPSVT